MKRRHLILVGLALLLFCFAFLTLRGQTYVYEIPLYGRELDADAFEVTFPKDIVSLRDKTVSDGVLRLTFRAEGRGKAVFEVFADGEPLKMDTLYVHPLGLITANTWFGSCTGGRIIPIAAALYAALLFWSLLRRYRSDMRENMYRYQNVVELGVLVLLGAVLLGQLLAARYTSLLEAASSAMNAASLLSSLMLPVAFVLSILITVSNLRLMRREGRTWRNMLGCILGVLLCVSTIAPMALGEILQRTTLVDVHNERGAALYIEMIVEQTIFVIVAYLECILIGTVLSGFRAARHIPSFDKDYIIILGCQIKRDGTLTPLLQSRVDRAMAFADMQRKATGKELVFVPSGGQGSDEVISEGEAMRRYLVERGVPEGRILPETKSKNTDENLKFSAALIRARENGRDANLAFSTTNYHVFRAGLLASRQGIRAEGIGSPTKRYFWINAFVREYIATLYAERKVHIRLLAALLALAYCGIGIVYLSVVM